MELLFSLSLSCSLSFASILLNFRAVLWFHHLSKRSSSCVWKQHKAITFWLNTVLYRRVNLYVCQGPYKRGLMHCTYFFRALSFNENEVVQTLTRLSTLPSQQGANTFILNWKYKWIYITWARKVTRWVICWTKSCHSHLVDKYYKIIAQGYLCL